MNQLKTKDINNLKKQILQSNENDQPSIQISKFQKVSFDVCEEIISENREGEDKENIFKLKCSSLASDIIRYISQYVLASKRNKPEKRFDAFKMQSRNEKIRLRDFGFDCIDYGDDEKLRRGRSGRIEEKIDIEMLNEEQKQNFNLLQLVNNLIISKNPQDSQLIITFEDYSQVLKQFQAIIPSLFFDGNTKKIILQDKYYDKFFQKLRQFLTNNPQIQNKQYEQLDVNKQNYIANLTPSLLPDTQYDLPVDLQSHKNIRQDQQNKQNSIETVYLNKIKSLILILALIFENNCFNYILQSDNFDNLLQKHLKKTEQSVQNVNQQVIINQLHDPLATENTNNDNNKTNQDIPKKNLSQIQDISSTQSYQSRVYSNQYLKDRAGFDFPYKVSKMWEDELEFESDSEMTNSEEEDDLFYYGYPHHHNKNNMNIDLLNPNSGQDSIIKQIFAQYDMQQYQVPLMMMMPQTTPRRRNSMDMQDSRNSNQNVFGLAQFFNPFAAASHHYNLHYTPQPHQYYQLSPQPIQHPQSHQHNHLTPPHINQQHNSLMNNYAQLSKQSQQQLQNQNSQQSQNNGTQPIHLQNQQLGQPQLQHKQQQQQQQINQQSQNLYGLGQQQQNQQQPHNMQQNAMNHGFNHYNLAPHNLHNLGYVQNLPINLHNNPHQHGQMFINAPPSHMFQMINNNNSQAFYNHLYQTQNINNQFFPIDLQPTTMFNGNKQGLVPNNSNNNQQLKNLESQQNEIIPNIKQQQIQQQISQNLGNNQQQSHQKINLQNNIYNQQQRSLSHPSQAASGFNILPSPESINSTNNQQQNQNNQCQQQLQQQQIIRNTSNFQDNNLQNLLPLPNIIQNHSLNQNNQITQQYLTNQNQQHQQIPSQQQTNNNIHNSNKKQNQNFNQTNQSISSNSSPSHNFNQNNLLNNNQQKNNSKSINQQMSGSQQHLQQYSNYKLNKNSQHNKDVSHLVSPVQKNQGHKQYQTNNGNNTQPPQSHSPLSALSLDDQMVGPGNSNNINSNNSINSNNQNSHFNNNQYNNHPYGFNQQINNQNNNNNFNNYQNNLRGANQKQQASSNNYTNNINQSSQNQTQNSTSRGQANSLGILPGSNNSNQSNFNTQQQNQNFINSRQQNQSNNLQYNKQNFQNSNNANQNSNQKVNQGQVNLSTNNNNTNLNSNNQVNQINNLNANQSNANNQINLPIITNIIQNTNIINPQQQQNQMQTSSNNSSISSNNSNSNNSNSHNSNNNQHNTFKNLKDQKRNNNFIRKPQNNQNNQSSNLNHNQNNTNNSNLNSS
ncbi:hypothetical protein ABPG74_007083 [Tetrahymena malaccensis]